MPGSVAARRVCGAILLLSAALAGCRGSSASRPTPPDPKAVVNGGTVRLGLGGPIQPDPAAANPGSPTELMVLDLLYDGLTRLDAKGTPVAALASSWTPDATLSSWDLHLDPAATFSSGRAVAAADVVASLERVAKRGDASLAAHRLEPIAGFQAFAGGSAEHLTGLTAVDPLTVRIALDQPLSVLPAILASPEMGIVDLPSLAAAVAARAGLAHLVTSSGWRVRNTSGAAVSLARRTGVAGHVDAIELRAYSSPIGAYLALEKGRVDWALVPPSRYRQAVQRYGDDAFAKFQAELFFGMRVKGPALSNPELRKAIEAAIDRDAIVRAVYARLAVPLSALVPQGVPGHATACTGCELDPAAARSRLAAAYPDGKIPAVALDFDDSPEQRDMAAIVVRDLEAVGIPVTPRPKPLSEYKSFVVSGAQELFSFGWIGGYGSPDAYLAPLFGSVANDNLTGYGNPRVDGALRAARAAADPAMAAAQWTEVERQILSEAVVVPIAQFRTEAVLQPRVRALQHAIDGSVDWSAVWLTDGS